MSDPQSIVDQIRAFIAATDQTRTPLLVDLASAYAALCTEANKRLRRCTDYLRKGLRAEAIHLADEQPALLDVLLILDIPEAPEWENICSMYELTRPPPLLIEASQELNEAYALTKPLDVLLDRHRRLALERAPLAERIAVMRELAQADAESTFWDEDIRAIESARVKELKGEVEAAVKKRDRSSLGRLLAELTSPEWRVPVSADLKTVVQRAELSCRQEETIRVIRKVAPDLEIAHRAGNLDAAVEVLAKIESLASDARTALPTDVQMQIAPAQKWIAEQQAENRRRKAFNDACAQLSLGLDRDAPLEELETLKNSAAALGNPIPADLLQRIAQRTTAAANAIKKRKLTRLLSAVAAVVVLGLVVGVVARSMSRSSRGEQVYSKLNRLVENGTPEDLKEADLYLTEVSANYAYTLDRSDVSRVVDDLKAKRTREQERASDFTKALNTARSAVDSATERKSTDASVWDDVKKKLNRAESAAVALSEKSQLTDLRDRAKASEKQFNSSEEQKVRAALAEIKEQTATLESDSSRGKSGINAAALLKRVNETKASADSAALASLAKEADELKDRIVKARDRMARGDKESVQLEAVKQACFSADALEKALKTFAQECPDSEHAERFIKAAAMAGSWEGIDKAGKLSGGFDDKMKPKVAIHTRRIANISNFLRNYADSPWAPAFGDYKDYLEAWDRTIADDGPWKNKDSRSRLTLPSVRECTYVQSADGKRYYIPPGKAVTAENGSSSAPFMISGAFLQTHDDKLLGRVSFNQPNVKANPIPLSQLAADIDKMAAALSDDWETFGFDVILKIVDAKDVDPVLRLILAKRAVEMAQKVAWSGKETLATIAKIWDAMDAEEVNWMSPDSPEVAKAREMATDLLGRAGELKKARDAATTERDDLHRRLRVGMSAKAVLLKEKLDWNGYTTAKLEEGRKLFVVSPKRGWLEVGSVQNGKFSLDTRLLEPEAQSLDGSMLFIVDP